MTGSISGFTPVAFQDWKEAKFQECHAMCVADCDGDGRDEIILCGITTEFPDFLAELRVVRFQPPDRLVQVGRAAWRGSGSAMASAVCAADVDNDGRVEIVVAGATYRRVRGGYPFQAQLRIMQFADSGLKTVDELTWTPDEDLIRKNLHAPFTVVGAFLQTVTVADVDGDGRPEIVCGGSVTVTVNHPAAPQSRYTLPWIEVFDWTRGAATRRRAKYRHFFWPGMEDPQGVPRGNAFVTDVACADIDADGAVEIVSVGNDEFSGELRSWGIRQGDAGPELHRKHSRDWPGVWGWSDGPNPIALRLRIDDLYRERGGLDVVTGGGAYDKGWGHGTEPFPPHSELFHADMRVWRPGSTIFIEKTGDLFWFKQSWLDFNRSGCRALCSADIDGDGRTEVLSLHEARPPVGGSPTYATILAWKTDESWSRAWGDIMWKRKWTFGIQNHSGRTLDTRSAGIWAGDIDGDGQVETVFSGYYADGVERGVFAGVVR